MGSHLAEYLLAKGLEVSGIDRQGSFGHIASVAQHISIYETDLSHETQVVSVLERSNPELIFHLAAQPSIPKSWEDPADTIVNNILGQLHLLKGVLALKMDPIILVVGSNEEYGLPRPEELPVKETSPFRPLNPYAVSKVAQDMMGYQYFLSHGVKCIRVRPFNHIGPRQKKGFVASDFASQVAEAEAGLTEPVIKVGNLKPKRDFTDVRDVVEGYYLALTKGEPGEVYNLGSGRAISIQFILDFFLAHSKVPITVEVDPARFRPVDTPMVYCDASKIKKQTGWQPRIPLEQTLADVLEYWRGAVKDSSKGKERR